MNGPNLCAGAYMRQHERVIFDNGGGATVQLGAWAHWYEDMGAAASDVAAYLRDGNTDGWYGHEEAALELDPDYESKASGGYRVWNIHSGAPFNDEYDSGFPILVQNEGAEPEAWGQNVLDFFTSLEKEIASWPND